MTKLIIFDFNRTLFNPDTGELMDGAQEVLGYFSQKNVSMALVSRLEPGRDGIYESLRIDDFFGKTRFVKDKSESVFEELVETFGVSKDDTVIVGDYVKDEIRIGNSIGVRTVRLKAGRFGELEPSDSKEEPWHTIGHLSELKEIL